MSLYRAVGLGALVAACSLGVAGCAQKGSDSTASVGVGSGTTATSAGATSPSTGTGSTTTSSGTPGDTGTSTTTTTTIGTATADAECSTALSYFGWLDQYQTAGDGMVWWCHRDQGGTWHLIHITMYECLGQHLSNHPQDVGPTTSCDS